MVKFDLFLPFVISPDLHQARNANHLISSVSLCICCRAATSRSICSRGTALTDTHNTHTLPYNKMPDAYMCSIMMRPRSSTCPFPNVPFIRLGISEHDPRILIHPLDEVPPIPRFQLIHHFLSPKLSHKLALLVYPYLTIPKFRAWRCRSCSRIGVYNGGWGRARGRCI